MAAWLGGPRFSLCLQGWGGNQGGEPAGTRRQILAWCDADPSQGQRHIRKLPFLEGFRPGHHLLGTRGSIRQAWGGRRDLSNDFQTVFKRNPFPQREASRGDRRRLRCRKGAGGEQEGSRAGLRSPDALLPPPFQLETSRSLPSTSLGRSASSLFSAHHPQERSTWHILEHLQGHCWLRRLHGPAAAPPLGMRPRSARAAAWPVETTPGGEAGSRTYSWDTGKGRGR